MGYSKTSNARTPGERLASSSCVRVRPNTPEFFSDVSSRVNEPARLRSLYSTGVEARATVTAQEFYRDRNFNGKPQFIPTLQQDIGDACIKKPACDHNAKYRTIDGFCNNLEFPEWGVTGVPLVRIFPALYRDERQNLRTSLDNQALPRARTLHTSMLASNSVAEDPVATYAVMSWGQLISHDTAKLVEHRPDDVNGNCLCCSRMGKELPNNDRPNSCAPILIPTNDPFFSKTQTTCLNFKRSVTTNDFGCRISPIQFVSDVSHFIDASFLYGSSNKAANRVRLKVGGLLRFQVANTGMFLPDLGNQHRHCPRSKVCYDAGDDRVNQNPMLTVLQTIFLRLHNQIAKQLETLNSHWSDETLYQESRKIVVAAVQRVSYTEYLPMIISPQAVRRHKLSGTAGMVIDQYNKFLNPGTLVSFTSAAFRIFHSTIPPTVKLLNEKRREVRSFKLSDVFFKPDLIQQDGAFPRFVRGLVTQPSQKMNAGFTKEITNLLFKSSRNGQGLDLVSADIMRGRDHGLPTYNQARISCGLPKFLDFNALSGNFPSEAVRLLRTHYSSVEDVDLYLGIIFEKPAEESKVGPLLQCILIEQFKRWKDGDRYFYTFLNNPGSFTEAQLKEVEKLSLAKIMCLTTDVENMQPNAFKQPNSRSNSLVPCNTMSQLDLSAWKESQR